MRAAGLFSAFALALLVGATGAMPASASSGGAASESSTATELAGSSFAAASQTLVLAAIVNGKDTGELITIRRSSNAFAAQAKDLNQIRVKLPISISPVEWVELDAIGGLAFRYDEPGQKLVLQLPIGMLQAHEVDLSQQAPIDPSAIKPIMGLVANYDLFASYTAMTRFGFFSTSALVGTHGANHRRPVIRLDSGWQWLDDQSVRSYVAGDFVSNSLSWTNSVRMGGLQISSAFRQRPDIVTTPIPQFSGSAACLCRYPSGHRTSIYRGAV